MTQLEERLFVELEKLQTGLVASGDKKMITIFWWLESCLRLLLGTNYEVSSLIAADYAESAFLENGRYTPVQKTLFKELMKLSQELECADTTRMAIYWWLSASTNLLLGADCKSSCKCASMIAVRAALQRGLR